MAATTVKLPKFGLTMEEATVNEWLVAVYLVAVGGTVSVGAPLAVVVGGRDEFERYSSKEA